MDIVHWYFNVLSNYIFIENTFGLKWKTNNKLKTTGQNSVVSSVQGILRKWKLLCFESNIGLCLNASVKRHNATSTETSMRDTPMIL